MSSKFKSTKKKPINFFIEYPEGGHSFLIQEYKKLREPDEFFDSKANKAYRFYKDYDAEGLASTVRTEYPFEQYIHDRFEDENYNSKDLISQFYKNNKDIREKELVYLKLLRSFTGHFNEAKNVPFYPDVELLISGLIEVVKYANHLYRNFFRSPLIKESKDIIKEEEKRIGQTGFILKKEPKKRIPAFHSVLISFPLIEKNSPIEHWYKFFNGHFPKEKINWIGEANQLRYFIMQLTVPELIENPPYQNFKYIPRMFKIKGENIVKNINKNNTYLNDPDKRRIDRLIKTLHQ